jgi:hypothetical protein
MNNSEHLTYSIDKNRLRIGAAIGVIVITAGFALGSVMHTSSSSANEPASPVTDNAITADETLTTGNESDQTTNNTSSAGSDQPVADKESVANATNQTEVAETVETTDGIEVEEADEAGAEATDEAGAEVEEVEANADETDTDDEVEEAEADADEAENDDDGNDEGNNNGLGWDLDLVFPGDILDEFIDPFPLPDDLGPIGPPSPGI